MPKTITSCYHCGEDCLEEQIQFDTHDFCCHGCKTVYTLLKETGLGTYYSIESNPGKTQNSNRQALEFLDLEEVKNSLVDFQEGTHNKITLYLPAIHCSACIWLLEKLNRLNSGVIRSDVNYLRKEVTILFDTAQISLKELVSLLESLGYSPDLQRKESSRSKSKHDTQLLIKLGLAGFVFGNVMLFSFPEYLNMDEHSLVGFKELFGWLNLLLCIPVLLYADSDYLIGAWKSLRVKYLTIDVPIALGIITLFGRSAFEIISGTGAGYFDSFAGLVFFLLVGKWFQSRTYSALAFDRDFKSYFPMAVAKIEHRKESVCLIENIKPGDHLRILNNQIIPADAVLTKGKAAIDYSFVSGESDIVTKRAGEKLYAGGRQTSGAIEIEVTNEITQGYLTKLWGQHLDNNAAERQHVTSIIDKTSRWFSAGILTIAFATLFAWLYIDASEAANAFTAVLIIACPCALALAMPFANGNVSRILGQAGFFLRNSATLETIASTDAFVFDKTGTLTGNGANRVSYHGHPLTDTERATIFSMSSSSTHPLSQALSKSLNIDARQDCMVKEEVGKGLSASQDGVVYKIGSAEWCLAPQEITEASTVHVSINGVYRGYFGVEKKLRSGIKTMINSLKNIGSLHLLSGDNPSERHLIEATFGQTENLHFNQSPEDKLLYLKSLNANGNTTLMFGDGLNDAGALKTADVGVAVADDVYSFSPACDVIMQSNRLKEFDKILKYIKSSISIVRWSIAISLLYNLVGLSFAIQAELTPIVAAILMPLSSITVVVFVSLLTTVLAPRFGR